MNTINDSGANVSGGNPDNPDELWRDQNLQTEGGKADKPYKNRVMSVFPTDKTREWSLPNITCMLSNTCFGYDTKNGGLDSPVCTFNTPGTICGFDINKGNENGLDPDLTLKKIGRGIYRMGLMESLCTCSSMDPTCGEPKMNTFTGQPDFWAAGGYTYASEESQKFLGNPPPETYYGKTVTGGFFAGLVNLITKFFVWIGNYDSDAKGACIPTERSPIGGTCWIGDSNCDATCIYKGADGSEEDCDITTYCDTSHPELMEADHVCTYYNLVDGGYTCSGDVETPYKGTMQAVNMPGGELAAVKEISLLLKSPFDPGSDFEAPPLCGFDAAVSDAKFQDDQPLVGHDTPCVDGPMYHSDKLRSVNRVYIPENTDLNKPKFGGGAGSGLNCNKSAPTPDPSMSNVLPLSDMLEALRNTIYNPFAANADVSKKNIEDCYNDVINTAINKHNDPAFVMATWIEESGASYYAKHPGAADFGCVGGGVKVEDFRAQLTCMVGLQQAYAVNPNHKECRALMPDKLKLNVKEYLQIFACGDTACREVPPGFDLSCTPNYVSQINLVYKTIHKSGNSLVEAKELPNTSWSN